MFLGFYVEFREVRCVAEESGREWDGGRRKRRKERKEKDKTEENRKEKQNRFRKKCK